MALRVPPGRAGRLWLRQRIAVAQRAVDLLDHKRRELDSERLRLHTVVERTRADWERATKEAQKWLGRVDVTGASRALRLAISLVPGPAEVEVEWRTVMGVLSIRPVSPLAFPRPYRCPISREGLHWLMRRPPTERRWKPQLPTLPQRPPTTV